MQIGSVLRSGRGVSAAISLVACLGGLIGASGCDGRRDNGRSDLDISLDFTPPSGGTSDVVWIGAGGQGGGLLLLDIVARDISESFDSYNVEILFDPVVAEAQNLSFGTVVSVCAGATPVLAAHNVTDDPNNTGRANLTGRILFSEAIQGAMPPDCAVAGTQTLARITLRARSRGTSSLDFVPFNGDPNNPVGTRFASRTPVDPEIPVLLFDSGALVEVTR